MTRSLWVGVAVAACVALIVSACVVFVVSLGGAPQSPSRGSWTNQAHTALDSVSSDLSTAQLLLDLAEGGKVMGNYQQIVALDSETGAGKVADHFAAEQPAPADQATYTLVSTTLSDATDLLTSVRIAVVRRDTARYPSLQRALTRMQTRLTVVEARVAT